jgi:hypothetical protein
MSRHARRVLETLSEETGGQAYFPKSVKEVDAIAKEVANDIRTQYTIAYHSTKSPTLGGYRQVHVGGQGEGIQQTLRAHPQRLLPARRLVILHVGLVPPRRDDRL